MTEILRGDIYYAYLDYGIGSEQNGKRPVLIIQNNVGNKYSPTVIVAVITSKLNKAVIPTHVLITPEQSGLPKTSIVLLEQIRTIDKRRLEQKVGHLEEKIMKEVDKALAVSLNINEILG